MKLDIIRSLEISTYALHGLSCAVLDHTLNKWFDWITNPEIGELVLEIDDSHIVVIASAPIKPLDEVIHRGRNWVVWQMSQRGNEELVHVELRDRPAA